MVKGSTVKKGYAVTSSYGLWLGINKSRYVVWGAALIKPNRQLVTALWGWLRMAAWSNKIKIDIKITVAIYNHR